MATRQIVPLLESSDFQVHFTDGAVILPDWQAALIPVDVKYVDCTYQEWVELVPNRHLLRSAADKVMQELLTQHFKSL